MDRMVKKPKIKPPKNAAEFRKDEIRVALDFAPQIYACKRCGWAVVQGFCCTTCGSSTPYEDNDNG